MNFALAALCRTEIFKNSFFMFNDKRMEQTTSTDTIFEKNSSFHLK